MIFRQLLHDDLGCASYLIGDEDAGVAAVVDPKLDIGEYLGLARFLGVHIEHILETHNHADHVSGHGRLASAPGATIHIHREAAPGYQHEPFDDGWELELGDLTVRALHTPGHRPEHTAFTLIDTHRSGEPWAVLTGDSLFVGDIARPDLAVEKAEGARGIFHSLNDKLMSLPDTCEVWPGHLGGSMCGGPGMDLKVSSTIGFERANQPLLQVRDEDDFVRRATSALRPQPPNFEYIVGFTGERTGIAAWLAEPGQPLVLVGRDDDDAREAAELAAAVGLTGIAGYLSGGMTSWREERQPVERVERLTVIELHDHWEDDRDGVRQVHGRKHGVGRQAETGRGSRELVLGESASLRPEDEGGGATSCSREVIRKLRQIERARPSAPAQRRRRDDDGGPRQSLGQASEPCDRRKDVVRSRREPSRLLVGGHRGLDEREGPEAEVLHDPGDRPEIGWIPGPHEDHGRGGRRQARTVYTGPPGTVSGLLRPYN